MATLKDIVAATELLSDDPESVMGGSPLKPKENESRVSTLRKCDGGSDSGAIVNEGIVESTDATVESAINVNESGEELVKNVTEKSEVARNSLVENGESMSTGNPLLNASEGKDDIMDGDEDGDKGASDENGKEKVQEKVYHVGDFVWGKIKSHPWWPGQIYDPEDASEFAMTRKQDGRHLVAFFGDGSCSWCSPSQLKPFVDNFMDMSRDSNSKSFLNAVERATDEVARLMELDMTCNCISKGKKEMLAKPEVTNAGVRAGVVMPDIDARRLSCPMYEPTDVLQKITQLAKVVSVGNGLDLAVLRSWLSAFYYFKGGHLLPVYHSPVHIEGLEDKNNDASETADDFSVPIEVPILGPQEDDWLSVPTAGSLNSQAVSENKVMHKRKQRSVAELMGESGSMKPESRKPASVKEDIDVEKSTTARKKKKKDSNGELKEAASEQPSSTGKRSRKRKGEDLGTPGITHAKDDDEDGVNGGKMPRKPKKINVSAAEIACEANEDSEIVSTPRERKKSKYLSPPYTNIALRVGNSSFKLEARVENDESTKTPRAGDHPEEQDVTASQPTSNSVDNGSLEKLRNGPMEILSTSVDTGIQTVKDDKKLSFPMSDVDVSVDELLSEMQHAGLDPFYLSKKGSLDMVWGFVSALRNSTYVHGADYKIYLKRRTGRSRKSRPSQLKDVSNKQIEDKTAKSSDQNTSSASKEQKKSDTKKSKKSAQTNVAKPITEAEEDRTLSCLVLTFTPGFHLPSKKDVVELFGKFGSLDTKETKVEKGCHSIRIVYTNVADAEAALKSSQSQCPYGSENVSYELQRSTAASESRRSLPKVSSPTIRAPENLEAAQPADALVLDLKTIKQKLEITTAIVENYHSRFSSEDKLSLKDEIKHLMEKIETVGDMVRVIAEKSTT